MPQTPPRPRQKGAAPDSEEEARLHAEFAAYAGSDADYAQYREADDEDPGPPPTLAEALAALKAAGTGDADDTRLGVPPAAIDNMTWLWRVQATVPERVALAQGLWDSGFQDAMIAAAKLLTQARLRPDDAAWTLILSWAPDLPAAAVADAVSSAAGRRVIADPARLAQVAGWCDAPNPWTRRAALMTTLPFAKLNHPDAAQTEARQTALTWCARLGRDPDPRVVKAAGQWLRMLAKHDAEGLRLWLGERKDLPKGLRRDAEKYL